jgi:hypothetical protein
MGIIRFSGEFRMVIFYVSGCEVHHTIAQLFDGAAVFGSGGSGTRILAYSALTSATGITAVLTLENDFP